MIALALAPVPGLSLIAGSQIPRWLWGLPLAALASRLLFDEAWRGQAVARALWPGGLAVLLAAAAEPLLERQLWPNPPPPLVPLAFLLLAASMAVWVSHRFTRAHRQLDQFRFELEQMVEDQTDELASTHRKLKSEVAERELVEEAMRMLERAVEQSIDGIAVTDLAGSTQFLNESWAQIHGYEVFEVLGYDLTLFHTPEQMQDQVFPLMKQVREGGAFQGEVWHRRKDGEVFPTWMSVTRLQDPDNEPVGMVAIARDVTDRRKSAEEQLRLETKAQQAEKLESLAKLAAGIAHDYNNLLTGVLGNASLALRELPGTSPARVKIRQIETAAERAATLSDQLLAYAGEDQLTLKTVEINDLVEEMRGELEAAAPEQVELEFHLNDGLPAIDVDPAQLRQVILNLLRTPASRSAGDRGVVALRTSKVRPTGPTSKARSSTRANRPASTPSSTSPTRDAASTRRCGSGCSIRSSPPRAPGRGLGLATALGIVRAHRGAIKVFSQVGRGTTVEVLLPAATRRPEAAAEVEDLQRWKGRGKVLVVDDEPLVREVAKDILEQHDFEVLTAGDGLEAVEIYRRQPGGHPRRHPRPDDAGDGRRAGVPRDPRHRSPGRRPADERLQQQAGRRRDGRRRSGRLPPQAIPSGRPGAQGQRGVGGVSRIIGVDCVRQASDPPDISQPRNADPRRATMHPQESDLIYDWNGSRRSTRPSAGIELDDETLRDGLQSPSVDDPADRAEDRDPPPDGRAGHRHRRRRSARRRPRARATSRRSAARSSTPKLTIRPTAPARTVIADIEPIVEISPESRASRSRSAPFIGSSPIRQYAEGWDVERLLEQTARGDRVRGRRTACR